MSVSEQADRLRLLAQASDWPSVDVQVARYNVSILSDHISDILGPGHPAVTPLVQRVWHLQQTLDTADDQLHELADALDTTANMITGG